MEAVATATGGALGRKTNQHTEAYEAKYNYSVAAKPLDFSFMKIQTVARKSPNRCNCPEKSHRRNEPLSIF